MAIQDRSFASESMKMQNRTPLRELARRIREGDQQATEQFYLEYEGPIRRAIRNRMGDARLNRYFDSADVFQSTVLALLKGTMDGADLFQNKENPLAIVYAIARNKLQCRIRRLKASKRNIDLEAGGMADLIDPLDSCGDICRSLRLDRLVDRVREAPDDVREIVNLRLAAQPWSQIAQHVGIKEDAARKRLKRWAEKMQSTLDE